MKTIPFNKDHARAGRPVVLKSGIPAKFIHAYGEKIWAIRSGDETPLTFNMNESYHPADPAPGHNPAGLDEWTVETRDGWRLLEKEEIYPRVDPIEVEKWRRDYWDSDGWDGFCGKWEGSVLGYTYRTKRPPGYFLPKPKPKTRPMRNEELPEVFLWKEKEDIRPSITHRASWTLEEIESAARDGWQWSRSLDGPWRPFTVEETQYAEKEESK